MLDEYTPPVSLSSGLVFHLVYLHPVLVVLLWETFQC